MPSIRKSLLQFVFAGAFMKRWNDKMRPMELLEVDKQAHKMIVAWLLYMHESQGLSLDERLKLGQTVIEGGLFEYFYRLVITDIKPPIFYQIKSNPDHYKLLTDWVLEQLAPRVQPLGGEFWSRLEAHFQGEPGESQGRRILEAAHLYASSWEFNLIKGVNLQDDEFKEIEASFTEGMANYTDLRGVEELIRGVETPLGRFAHLCGQLRFQKRWSQTPRVPETSVIGHMFLVACYAYFFSIALGACEARRQNNFFAGLFHDMPELLTRDIISPVKKSIRHVAELIKEYEDSELSRRVLIPLEQGGHGHISRRLCYFLGLEVGSEFKNTVLQDGVIAEISFEELSGPYNRNEADPKDGDALKICDTLAAFIEAYTALRNGISSDQLQQALWRMRERYQNTMLADLHIGALLADFD